MGTCREENLRVQTRFYVPKNNGFLIGKPRRDFKQARFSRELDVSNRQTAGKR